MLSFKPLALKTTQLEGKPKKATSRINVILEISSGEQNQSCLPMDLITGTRITTVTCITLIVFFVIFFYKIKLSLIKT